jgi:hypothetical protein
MRIVGFRVEPISKHHQYDGEFTAGNHLLTHSFTYSLTHSLTRFSGSTKLKSCASGETITNEPATYQSIDKADTVVTHSLTYLLTYSLTYSLTHSLTGCFHLRCDVGAVE